MVVHPSCIECKQMLIEGTTRLQYVAYPVTVVVSHVPAWVCPKEHAFIASSKAIEIDEAVQDFFEKIAAIYKI